MKKVTLKLGVIAAVASVIGLTACGGSSVTNVALGGNISGLTTDGLVLTDTLNLLPVAANSTTFLFPGRITVGVTYAVAVSTQPQLQTCTVVNGIGTASTSDINNVQVNCVANNELRGNISGLTAAGLALANGSDVVHPAAGDTTFKFGSRVADGATYGVTILSQPAGQTCSVINGAGKMGSTDVTNVQVNCV